MISKTDLRIISLMLEKIERLIKITSEKDRAEIESNYILSDAIQFEFEKLYQDSNRLSTEIRVVYGQKLHIDELRSIRNRVAHDYESVSLKILIDTVEEDMPALKKDLELLRDDLLKNKPF